MGQSSRMLLRRHALDSNGSLKKVPVLGGAQINPSATKGCGLEVSLYISGVAPGLCLRVLATSHWTISSLGVERDGKMIFALYLKYSPPPRTLTGQDLASSVSIWIARL